MWEVDCEEGWVPKNWCFWTGIGEDSWECLMKLTLNVHWKDWCWSWGSDTLATWCEESTHWCWCCDPDAGKDWGQEKGTTEDEMAGWHHQLNGHEFEQAPGAGEGQRSLACCSPWGHRELDMTEWLNDRHCAYGKTWCLHIHVLLHLNMTTSRGSQADWLREGGEEHQSRNASFDSSEELTEKPSLSRQKPKSCTNSFLW